MLMPTRPTLHDVAGRAGVSKSTVSRVLNSHPHVGSETREAVNEAMRELGYERNEVARSLRTNETLAVGLIVGALRNEVFAAIAQGVERVLVDSDRMLVIANSNGDTAREQRAIREFQGRGVDGLIMSLADERSRAVVAQLQQVSCPIVLLDRDGKGIPADRVLTDHGPGVSDAVEDLRAHGHVRTGLVCPPDFVRAGREVRAAFVTAHGDGDLVRSGTLTQAHGYESIKELLALPDPPTGVIIVGIEVLVGVLTALDELGLRVPTDLSLISYDDSAAARFHTPPISTLTRDSERIGEIAARLVLERINGRRRTLRKIFVSTGYERRGSVSHARPRRP
jgi:LacI family transcriptional regulator